MPGCLDGLLGGGGESKNSDVRVQAAVSNELRTFQDTFFQKLDTTLSSRFPESKDLQDLRNQLQAVTHQKGELECDLVSLQMEKSNFQSQLQARDRQIANLERDLATAQDQSQLQARDRQIANLERDLATAQEQVALLTKERNARTNFVETPAAPPVIPVSEQRSGARQFQEREQETVRALQVQAHQALDEAMKGSRSRSHSPLRPARDEADKVSARERDELSSALDRALKGTDRIELERAIQRSRGKVRKEDTDRAELVLQERQRVHTALDHAKLGMDVNELKRAIDEARGKVPDEEIDRAEVVLQEKEVAMRNWQSPTKRESMMSGTSSLAERVAEQRAVYFSEPVVEQQALAVDKFRTMQIGTGSNLKVSPRLQEADAYLTGLLSSTDASATTHAFKDAAPKPMDQELVKDLDELERWALSMSSVPKR